MANLTGNLNFILRFNIAKKKVNHYRYHYPLRLLITITDYRYRYRYHYPLPLPFIAKIFLSKIFFL